eukprot:192214-Pleurochrysis_carterae.AAC.1
MPARSSQRETVADAAAAPIQQPRRQAMTLAASGLDCDACGLRRSVGAIAAAAYSHTAKAAKKIA